MAVAEMLQDEAEAARREMLRHCEFGRTELASGFSGLEDGLRRGADAIIAAIGDEPWLVWPAAMMELRSRETAWAVARGITS